MCGIAGMLRLTDASPVPPERMARMLHAIRHRGPDQFGIYTFQDHRRALALGNARLSIIDLAGGQQPISNEDGTLWIVFNGEIFNYVELRPDLERLGHEFSTTSDTEVILHLYEEYGPACVNHLNGQFAFAIWNEREHALFMARDRLGVRPLYYTTQTGDLIFASEIKALFTDRDLRAELDTATLDQIFTYWSPLAPRTVFKDVLTLPPGHWLQVNAHGEIQIEAYWRPEFSPPPRHDELPEAEYATALFDLLRDATMIRLRADVPVGAYLSGGLDSSVIAALIHRYTPRRLETFSIGFADESYDERPFQLAMAKHLGTRHHVITCTHEQIGATFPDVIRHVETPILRTSPVPLYLLSQLVHQHDFKVVLTGEGADEFLGGYNIFKEAKIRRYWANEPDSVQRPALLKKLYPYIANLGHSNDAYLRQFFGKDLADIHAPDYSHRIRWDNTSRAKRFFAAHLRAELDTRARSAWTDLALPPDFGGWEPLAQAQFLEINIFLSEYLLSAQGDRVAMAHAVEGRFPFLDYRVVEFCNRLPARLKLRGLNEKYLLKRAMRDLLPQDIWQRPKRPYRAPIQLSFFPNGKPLDWVAEMLAPHTIRAAGYFDETAIAGLLRKLARFGVLGETDEMALTGILSTQLLHHYFLGAMPCATGMQAGALGANDDVKLIMRGETITA